MPMKVGLAKRGPYEADEPRPLLRDRPAGGTWTEFEARMFNLVTQGYDRGPVGGGRLFSRRLAAVEAALRVVDEVMTGVDPT